MAAFGSGPALRSHPSSVAGDAGETPGRVSPDPFPVSPKPDVPGRLRIGLEGRRGFGHVPTLLQPFLQTAYAGSAEAQEVERVATALLAHMNEPATDAAIRAANAPGRSSVGVQDVLLPVLLSQGFKDESKDLFAGYETSAVRPDFFRRVGASGILLEVERGKTTINNMDFLDFWKCHLCEHANYLFLLVPQELRQNETPDHRATRPYNAVVKRLRSFFVPRNYTNVRGLFIFGY